MTLPKLPKLLVLTVPEGRDPGHCLRVVQSAPVAYAEAVVAELLAYSARLVDLEAELKPAPDECDTLIETAYDDGWNAALRRIAEGGGA